MRILDKTEWIAGELSSLLNGWLKGIINDDELMNVI